MVYIKLTCTHHHYKAYDVIITINIYVTLRC